MLWSTGLLAAVVLGTRAHGASVDACPGYKASNVQTTPSTLTADLLLAGKACNVYGEDVTKLKLEVAYETRTFFRFPFLTWLTSMRRNAHSSQDQRPGP
jgi:hypothetical protein